MKPGPLTDYGPGFRQAPEFFALLFLGRRLHLGSFSLAVHGRLLEGKAESVEIEAVALA